MGARSGGRRRSWVRAACAAVVVAWLLAACAGGIPASGLDLRVTGLPPGAAARVEVRYDRELLLTASGSGFVELPPGVYSVRAYRTEDLSHAPEEVGTVLVLSGRRTPVTVAYRPVRLATYVPTVVGADALRPAIDALGAEHVRLETGAELIASLAASAADAYFVSIHAGPMDGALAAALAAAVEDGVRIAFHYWNEHPVWEAFAVTQTVPVATTWLSMAPEGGFGDGLPVSVALVIPASGTNALALGGLGFAWCQTSALASCGLRLTGAGFLPVGFASDAFVDPAQGRRVFQNLARALLD